jgi:GxxExxY protein
MRTAPDSSVAAGALAEFPPLGFTALLKTHTKSTTVTTNTENEIAKHILDAAFLVHTKLGPGVFESVYEVLVAHELTKKGLFVERQKPVSIIYDGIQFDEAFRSDLIVDRKVIAELKSVQALSPVHAKQVLTQLRLTGLRLGLLINFSEAHLKNGI